MTWLKMPLQLVAQLSQVSANISMTQNQLIGATLPFFTIWDPNLHFSIKRTLQEKHRQHG